MVSSAYLEDFYSIKVIISKELWIENEKWKAVSLEKTVSLNLLKIDNLFNDLHIYFECSEEINPDIDYKIVRSDGFSISLKLGKITRSKLFEKKYYFSNWLGFKYQKKHTTFRVWTPVSKEVYLVLNGKKIEMDKYQNGVWQVDVSGDCDKMSYYYHFRINNEFIDSLDPYAISSNANHSINYVIDWNKTYKMKNSYYRAENFSKNMMIIYEISVRDSTSFTKRNDKCTFKALKESTKESYGLGKIKKLGITHLQLLPIFAFGGVDELIRDSSNKEFKYNWGYNPMQYFVPSGFYSTNPNDPYARINELKELIDEIHSLKMGANMDVVYNHVYDHECFPLERLVPGYTFRTKDDGYLTNSSWCGNDLKTDHLMVRKLIIDSVIHFQEKYLIDGFRFDLMGLIDIDTINSIYSRLMENNHQSIVYGEGWNMDVSISEEERCNLNNCHKLDNVSFFNDYYRNVAKFILIDKEVKKELLLNIVRGCTSYSGKFLKSSQSINYLECHDNETLADYLRENNIKEENIKDYVRLALGLIIFSEGIPFIHAGMEHLRTKFGSHNSYNLSDDYNKIDWNEALDIEKTLIDMISIRKEYHNFYYDNIMDIEKKIKLDVHSSIPTIRIFFKDGRNIQIVIKNDYKLDTKFFSPYTQIIFDGEKRCLTTVEKYDFKKPGVYLFIK